jgi:uncharacterized protein YndB with AHSA1/START domain
MAKMKVRKRSKAKAPARPRKSARAARPAKKAGAVAAKKRSKTKNKSKRKAASARRAREKRDVPKGPPQLDTIKLAYLLRAPASTIYRVLIDPAEHAAFLDDKVELDARPGGAFRVFKGFITGTVVELVPDARIVQKWRTKHFPPANPDSTVEITLTPVPDGTRLDLRHIDVPKEQVGYLVDGWLKYYWGPLSKYLTRSSVPPPRLA